MKIISSWSGGKDSCYALMKALESNHELKCLLNMMNENGEISRSHAIKKSLLEQQADRIGVPLKTVSATWDEYEIKYVDALAELTSSYEVEGVVFGDIDLESHREWEEKVCATSSLEALLPLWQGNRKELVFQMIDAGIKAIITSCNTDLGFEFLGEEVTYDLADRLEAKGVDVCGENGEYHTIVVDCPIFSKPVDLLPYKKVKHGEYCFLDWIEG